MTNNDTLTELISKAQKGDKNAENELCCRSYQQILKYLHRYKCSSWNIDDIAQESMIKLITILPTLKIEQYGYNRYLQKTTWSVYIDFYRKYNRELQYIDTDFNDLFEISYYKASNNLDKVAIKEHLRNVCSAICSFKDSQKQIIYLSAFRNMGIKRIAPKIKKSVGYVHQNLTQARNQLLELFPEHTTRRYAR